MAGWVRSVPSSGNGRPAEAVVSIEGPTAILDGNHPLAGKTLVFEVEVRKVYAGTAEDLTHGHVH